MIIRPSDHTTYYFRTKSFSYKIPQGAFKNCVDNGKGILLQLYVQGNMHIIFDITNTTYLPISSCERTLRAFNNHEKTGENSNPECKHTRNA